MNIPAEVIDKIRVVQEQGLDTLDLHSSELDFIPEDIFKLEKLVYLNLSGNNLTEIPSEIKYLKNLQTLNLSFNWLLGLPKEIGCLRNLNNLDLMWCHLESVAVEIFELEKLQHLDLADNNLSEVLSGLQNLKGLKFLNLNNTNIVESLVAEIFELEELESLFLIDNNLTQISSNIQRLTKLKFLALDKNPLNGLPPEIEYLQELTDLSIDYCQLKSLPAEIFKLKQLATLNAAHNNLTEIPTPTTQLMELRCLNFSNNPLTSLPKELGYFCGLKELYLNNCNLEAIPAEIEHLYELTDLYINSCQLKSLPAEIFKLKQLVTLNVAHNNLTEIPTPATQLMELRCLSLSNNPLTSLPKEVGHFCGLKGLYLDNCNLEAIPVEILKIKSLAVLSLVNNNLTEIPQIPNDEIPKDKKELKCYKEQLNNLKVLNLKSNRLTEIPSQIGLLHQLRVLDLQGNKLTGLPKEIRYLDKLKKLILKQNQYHKFPKIVRQLKNLRELDLSSNQIKGLPSDLNGFCSLNKIDLSSNRLEKISEEIVNLPNLKTLSLKGNPLRIPDPVIARRGLNAIRNYFDELRESGKTDYLCEIKLLLVGEGNVGKTSLAKSLINPDYILPEIEHSTEGIDISRWIIPANENSLGKDVRINIWDFGGQEIYRYTHQFFFTKRSLYILVTESRREDKPEDFYYWLNIIKSLSQASPVIIVLNKCDQRYVDLPPLKEYREIFRNIEYSEKVSCIPAQKHTINTLKADIKSIISRPKYSRFIKTPIPKKWIDIRNELENMRQAGKNYINVEEYVSLCKNFGMDRRKALSLSGYFHDLGIILHFRNDNQIVLNPQWITQGVYKILDDQKVKDNKGEFYERDLTRIWHNSEYKDKYLKLLSLMKKFEICFELGSGSGKYLAPGLLPVNKVDNYEWRSDKNNLHFEYRYTFMPKGLLVQFISKNHEKIYKNTYWKYGVLLGDDKTRAIVEEKYFERKITITVEGDCKKELLYDIRNTFERIHNKFQGLKVEEMIPCNCETCSKCKTPYFFEYSRLEQYVAQKFEEIHCCNEKITPVKVADLLEGVNGKSETTTKRPNPVKDDIPQFDVFLSHNSVDKPWVIRLKDDLSRYGVLAWLDKDEIRPGDVFAKVLERALDKSRAVAFIISPEAIKSGWVEKEYYLALSLTQSTSAQLIPVILRDAKVPGFLNICNKVDFRDETAYAQSVWRLVWGITGKKPDQVLDLR